MSSPAQSSGILDTGQSETAGSAGSTGFRSSAAPPTPAASAGSSKKRQIPEEDSYYEQQFSSLDQPQGQQQSKRPRSKRACTKCQSRKTKCSGDKPCSYCVMLNKPNECVFIVKEKPKLVTLQESYVNLLKFKIEELEKKLQNSKLSKYHDVLEENNAATSTASTLSPSAHLIQTTSSDTNTIEQGQDQEQNSERQDSDDGMPGASNNKPPNRRMSLNHIINADTRRIAGDQASSLAVLRQFARGDPSRNHHASILNPTTSTINSTSAGIIPTNNNSNNDYVLEKELNLHNLLVQTDVSYLTNFNIFLGNSNCTKYNLTIQNILTDKLNYLLDFHNQRHNLQIKLLPPPILPTVFYKSKALHWNRINIADIQLPEKDYALKVINSAFEILGADFVIVNYYEVLLMIDRIYSNIANCNKLHIIQLLVLLAMGEITISTKQSILKAQFPGFTYFQTAVELFEDTFEECSITYIETTVLLGIYSLALNRKDSAYIYTGLAIRLAYTMGLHRKVPPSFNGLSKIELERRRRLWWSCYIWDRLVTTRLGHPIMINDDSMDVELPSNEQFTTNEELKRFPKRPTYFIEQIKLAKISGIIMNKIYSIKNSGKFKDSFIVSVHSILNILRNWYADLNDSKTALNELNNQPSNNNSNSNSRINLSGSDGSANISSAFSNDSLRLNYINMDEGLKRQTYSLHMNYNYCIILTTRPLLLYVFKEIVHHVETEHSPTTLGILKSCINAAFINLKIINMLYLQNIFTSFTLMDNNIVFGSILIMLLTNFIKNYSRQGYLLFVKTFGKNQQYPNNISADKISEKNDTSSSSTHHSNTSINNGTTHTSLTQKDITSKIKFGISILKKGTQAGSVTAKVYFLQLSNLMALLDKLNYISSAAYYQHYVVAVPLPPPSPETELANFQDLKSRLKFISRDVITDAGLFNQINLVEHDESSVANSSVTGNESNRLDDDNHAHSDNVRYNINEGEKNNARGNPISTSTGVGSENDNKGPENYGNEKQAHQHHLQSQINSSALSIHDNNSANGTVDEVNDLNDHRSQHSHKDKNFSNSHAFGVTSCGGNSQGSTPSVSYFDQEMFTNDEFNLLNDELLTNFLDSGGWQGAFSPTATNAAIGKNEVIKKSDTPESSLLNNFKSNNIDNNNDEDSKDIIKDRHIDANGNLSDSSFSGVLDRKIDFLRGKCVINGRSLLNDPYAHSIINVNNSNNSGNSDKNNFNQTKNDALEFPLKHHNVKGAHNMANSGVGTKAGMSTTNDDNINRNNIAKLNGDDINFFSDIMSIFTIPKIPEHTVNLNKHDDDGDNE